MANHRRLSILCLAIITGLGASTGRVFAKPHWTPILAEGRGSIWTFGDSGPLPQYFNWQHEVPPKDFYDPSGVPAGDVMGIFTFKQAHVHSESYTNDSHHPGEIGARWSWAWVDDNGLPLTTKPPHGYYIADIYWGLDNFGTNGTNWTASFKFPDGTTFNSSALQSNALHGEYTTEPMHPVWNPEIGAYVVRSQWETASYFFEVDSSIYSYVTTSLLLIIAPTSLPH